MRGSSWTGTRTSSEGELLIPAPLTPSRPGFSPGSKARLCLRANASTHPGRLLCLPQHLCGLPLTADSFDAARLQGPGRFEGEDTRQGVAAFRPVIRLYD